jgi:glutamate formiminotransferase
VAGAQVLTECVINVSEGRSTETIDAIRIAGGPEVLDVHSDPEHHRSVLTLGGPLDAVEDAARRVVAEAVARIDLRAHAGIHPRLGAADVVPFVPLPSCGRSAVAPSEGSAGDAWSRVVEARDRFAVWAATTLQLPCFLYGPERSLPEVRRRAFRSLAPDTGPSEPHPTAGASAVGARPVLVAYNVWIAGASSGTPEEEHARAVAVARSLASDLRGPAVRSLGFAVDAAAQVSFNLIDPVARSVVDVYDAVAAGAESKGCKVLRAELVGLAPAVVLDAVPRHRWAELDLTEDRTIEGRLDDNQSPTAGTR